MYGTETRATGQDRLYAHLYRIAEPDDVDFLTGQFAPIPPSYQPKLLKEYDSIKKSEGRTEANQWTFGLHDLFSNRGLNYAADDDEIVETAEQAAHSVRSKLPHCTSEETKLEMLAKAAEKYGIEMPQRKKLSETMQRMSAEKWWRRQLRKRFQKIESAAIRTGFVHKRAGLYASDETVNRRQKQKRKNAKLLESLEAVHDQTGEVCTLAELAATNVSNPSIRRKELMTRIRGIEEFATLIGYSGLFLTLTTPSRMHARSSNDGAVNPSYNNTRPDSAQRYLLDKVWAPVMSKLKRDGVDYFGVRIVEPHHDGTPHWHMLVFVKPEHQATFTEIMREYALRDSPDEPGAQKHRFTVTQINPSKGSAAGYVAKYIAKNIDGFAVGDDYEADTHTDASETSVRVEAWASLWHIRQFQFFGTPSVTPYRELRRVEALPESMQDVLGEAHRAADEGDWRTYMKLYRDGLRIKPLWEERTSSTYQDEINKRVRGIIVNGENGEIRLTTREGEWEIREKESARQARVCPPWTCVNNSTPKTNKGILSKEALTYSNESNGNGEKISSQNDEWLNGAELERWIASRAKEGWSIAQLQEMEMMATTRGIVGHREPPRTGTRLAQVGELL